MLLVVLMSLLISHTLSHFFVLSLVSACATVLKAAS